MSVDNPVDFKIYAIFDNLYLNNKGTEFNSVNNVHYIVYFTFSARVIILCLAKENCQN